jgi:tensin
LPCFVFYVSRCAFVTLPHIVSAFLQLHVTPHRTQFALGPPLKNSKTDNAKDGANDKDTANRDSEASADNSKDQQDEKKNRMGCAPYLQVFQAGQLMHTVAATLHFQQQPEALPFCQVADGSIAFHVDQVIQGDVLIRCRHLAHSTKQKVSMFRAAFHTGYVPPNVLRFTKAQLDGACHDPRFPEDFFVDLILEPCSAEQVSNFHAQQEADMKEKEKAAAEAEGKAVGDEVVSASTYDSMLHRDSRFWDVISEHLDAQESKQDESGANATEQDPIRLRMRKTVGKRRVFTSTPKTAKGGESTTEESNAKKSSAQEPLQTFSIGGELDFLPEPEKKTSPRPKQQPKSPKKDSLMEALMGALGDEHEVYDTEEIVFEDTPAPALAPASTAVQASPTIVDLPPAPAGAVTNQEDAAAKIGSEIHANAGSEAMAESGAPSGTKDSPPTEQQETTEATESMKDMEQLLQSEDSDGVDVDALLGDDDDDDDFNLDDYNADEEDAELEDLENFLSQTK